MSNSVKTNIYVWCNSCGNEWHSFCAVGEDGTPFPGHVCSDHGFACNDMIAWKKKHYDAAYGEDKWSLTLLEHDKCSGRFNLGEEYALRGGFTAYELTDLTQHAGLSAALEMLSAALEMSKSKECTDRE